MTLTLTIRLSNGTKFDTTIVSTTPAENTTVLQLKDHIATLQESDNCPRSNQRLIYKGRILDNDRTLADYGIANQCTIFLVKSGATASSTKSPSAPLASTIATSSATNNSTTAFQQSQQQQQQQPAQSPMPFIFPPPPPPAASRGGLTPPSPFGDGGAGMGHGGMMNDPSEVLNNPFVQNMLDSNPDFLRNMMRQQLESNPALQQLMDSNPAVRHMLNDPNQFDEMIRMIRNPAAMQQAMRSQDLALSQIENMPGGFAALSNMYETMQRPLEEGFAEQRSAHSNGSETANHHASSSGSHEGATGAAMPNPWGSPAPQPSARATMNNNNTGTNTGSASNPFTAPFSPGQNPLLANMFGAGNAPAGGGAPGTNAMDPFGMMMGGGSGLGGNAGMMGGNRGLGGQQQQQQMPSADQRQAAFQMLQSNPAMLQMMQQAIRSNPGMFRQMISTNQDPMTSMMFQNMTDEQFATALTEMMNPETMNRMMQMEQQLGGLHFGGGAGHGAAGAAPAFPPPPAFNPWATNRNTATTAPSGPTVGGTMPGLDFSSLLFGPAAPASGGGAASFLSNINNNNNMPPAERYRVQLRSLYDMGFDDEIRSITALQAAHGNLNRAVDMLLSGEVPVTPAVTAAAASSTVGATTLPSSDQAAESMSSSSSSNTASEDPPSAEDQQPKDPSEKKND